MKLCGGLARGALCDPPLEIDLAEEPFAADADRKDRFSYTFRRKKAALDEALRLREQYELEPPVGAELQDDAGCAEPHGFDHLVVADRLQRGTAVGAALGDFKIGLAFEQAPQAVEHDRVIVPGRRR